MSKSSGSPLALLILVAALIAIAVLFAGALILWPLFNAYKYLVARKDASEQRELFGIHPNSDSFHEFSILDDKAELALYVSAIKKERAALVPLVTKLRGLGPLTRNKDGSYSKRSKKGKFAAELANQISIHERKIYRYKSSIESIKRKPSRMWRDWLEGVRPYLANRNALLLMLMLFPLLFLMLGALENGDFLYGFNLYVYSALVLPVQLCGELTGFYLLPQDKIGILSAPYWDGFSIQTWAIVMTPVPILTYLGYKISSTYYSHALQKKVPDPGPHVLLRGQEQWPLSNQASQESETRKLDTSNRASKTRIVISLVLAVIPLFGFLPSYQIFFRGKRWLGLACLAIQIAVIWYFANLKV